MKDLKTLLEVRKANQNTVTKNDNVSVSLNIANIENILFALAYVYKNDHEADKWKRAEYESLYISLYKEASKVFTSNELSEFGFSDDIEKVQTKY